MCHIEKGLQSNLTIIFSCPGRYEEEAGMPAAGQTGINLDGILEIIDQKHSLSWKREDVTITNAWDKVEYISKTGRNEATKTEVLSASNLKRLLSEIKDTKNYIITFGDRAEMAVKAVIDQYSLNVKVVSAPHLSLQRLNSFIIVPTSLTPNQRTKYRLKVVAEKILEQLNDNK